MPQFARGNAAPTAGMEVQSDLQRPLVVIPDDVAGRYGGSPDELSVLRGLAEVVIHETRPSQGELIERIQRADIVLSFRPAFTKFPAEVLEKCSRLRYICIAGAGVEDVDVAFATSRRIAIGNIRGNKRAIAEFCLALMFDVARRLSEQDRAVRSGVWKALPGIELGDRTLGVVGLSAIAREFIPLARAVGMHVLSWSRDNRPERAAAVGALATDLDTLLAQSDVVSIHLRLFPELRAFFDTAKFDRMKPGAILLNTARAELVDEAALVAALKRGRLRGAALDVLSQMPLPSGHPLLDQPNVVLTPLAAWNTLDAAQRALRNSIENVISFISGKPVGIVNGARIGLM